MDNEEKFNKNNGEQTPHNSENSGNVRYRKVNVYSSGNSAFERSESRSGYRGGSYSHSREDRGYRSYRNGGNSQDGFRHQYGSSPYHYGKREYGGGNKDFERIGRHNQYSRVMPQDKNENYSNNGFGENRPYGEGSRGGRYEYRARRSSFSGGEQARPFRKKFHDGDYNPNAKYSLRKRIQYAEDNYDPEAPIRLNKFLANAGVCSRRDADKYITAGVVTVNGEVVTELGTKIKRNDVVRFNNETVSIEKKVYVLLNKPKDYVTTSDDPQNRKTVMDLVRNICRERIYPVGRLDRNTTGVLLLTNDGELASKLTHPKYKKKKIYHVYLDRKVTAADMKQIADGIMLDDGEVHADAIEYASQTDKKQIGIEIHSGKNRIVRRIFESLGYHVKKLDRVYFAGLTKKNLRRGQWRYLSQEEVNYLKMGEFE